MSAACGFKRTRKDLNKTKAEDFGCLQMDNE